MATNTAVHTPTKITRKDITKAATAVTRAHKRLDTAQEQADYWNGRVLDCEKAHAEAVANLERLMKKFTSGE